MKNNGINHVKIPSYHPASNGQAETIVGKFKGAMKRMCMKNPDIMCNLANWLINYRNTPHSITGIEPAVAMLGRRTRNTLSLLHPLSNSRAMKKSCEQEQTALDKESSKRMFEVGERILYWDEHHRLWNEGTIKEKHGTKLFVIETERGETRKHLDHMVKNHSQPNVDGPINSSPSLSEALLKPNSANSDGINPINEHDHKAADKPVPNILDNSKSVIVNEPKPPVEPVSKPKGAQLPVPAALGKRVRNPPDRLGYSKLGGDK